MLAMNGPPTNPDRFPAASGPLLLVGAAGVIEAEVGLPSPEAECAGTAIVCHPHPLHGGTMHNKVVTTLERALRELGLRTVRFNFRGVGGSQGCHDGGDGEAQDARLVAEWVEATRPRDELWLAGFSFGACVSARVAGGRAVRRLVSIAPPMDRCTVDPRTVTCPWLVVQGERDEVVAPQAVYAFVENAPRPIDLVRMPDTGHFFHGKLLDLRAALKKELQPHLPASLAGTVPEH